MAENDQNDEYKFDEYESYDHESMDNINYDETGSSQPSEQLPKPPKKDVWRNALITLGVVVAIMVGYKVVGGLFSGKSSAPQVATKPEPVAKTSQPIQAVIAPQPIQPSAPQVVQVESPALKQQVESIVTNQQNVQTQITSMSEQVGNVNNNVTNLASQLNQLNQIITDLTNQLNKQSEEINILMQRTKPKPIRRVTRPQHVSETNIYYINAVIPGRAWLIGTNGSTLTVREGTKIVGYGVVKLIDPMEGRVLTSSGRIIRFSQDDS